MKVSPATSRGAHSPVSGSDPASGPWIVLASAVVWSFGGTFARFLGALDPWAVVFWRAVWAAAFLLGFMVLRDGPRATAGLFRAMGRAGLAVAFCFTTASSAFVVALQFTTVANVLLIQAGVPLIAALMAWALFGERASGPTWAAIAAVLLGVAVMVSPSLTGATDPTGDLLGLVVALAFASATVITRRHAHLRMAPAVCLGMMIAAGGAALVLFFRGAGVGVTAGEMALLAGFGALNLGLGLALFVTGARMVPAAIAALLGTAETLLGPLWVWLIFGETPGAPTLLGGGIVLAGLVEHLLWQIGARRVA